MEEQLKCKLTSATAVVSNQLTKLKMLDKRISLLDKDFRYKIDCSIRNGNNAHARALAIELSNIHHVQQITKNMSLALEVIVIRFSTVNEFAKILEAINPTIEIIKDIQMDISNVAPAAREVFYEMTSMAADVLLDSRVKSNAAKISGHVDMDTLSILNEVEGLLESEAKAKLPEVPECLVQEQKNSSNREEQILDGNRILLEG
jgi:division protein CdvB (Snf7/Vps24/ESCRT-III family)